MGIPVFIKSRTGILKGSVIFSSSLKLGITPRVSVVSYGFAQEDLPQRQESNLRSREFSGMFLAQRVSALLHPRLMTAY